MVFRKGTDDAAGALEEGSKQPTTQPRVGAGYDDDNDRRDEGEEELPRPRWRRG